MGTYLTGGFGVTRTDVRVAPSQGAVRGGRGALV